MGMLSEFKSFAMKGNLVDMAVGFVMGSAFATVVTAFTQGVFLPLLSPVMGGIDLSEMKFTVSEAVLAADGTVLTDAAVVDFGTFLSATISFIIVAFVMFMIIKGLNKAKKKEEAAPSAPPADQVLLAEIRDLLARQNAKL
ncbi:large-conductance mechanosensitive channel [Algimonas arctica]|uniref:Large-conductance mechanosensitive channel n=1 Tax=Algimonas arctica TaxID=1479486 RepID=A0A8J3G2H4_9PROT|nr:large conductance mechanosensitive channel protein MscL [Algimonas arctica]GHA94889.1 large-conductance mechanosensitive channel [Algimonas arctica]